MWNKILVSEDAIGYEKKSKDVSIRLEARFSGDEWVVYRGFYTHSGLSYTEEYLVRTRDEAENMIYNLKKEKDPTRDQVAMLMKERSKKLNINVKRSFRDESVEKWFFTVNEDNIKNFFLIHDGDKIEIDVILNEKYFSRKDDIIKEISSVLSLEELDVEIGFDIYFFNKLNSNIIYDKRKAIFDRYEVEFDFK